MIEKNLTEFEMQLRGFQLTTAEILYHMPDHQDLLQSFIWQDYDHLPTYPQLKKFLAYWHQNLDGPLHSVKLASKQEISAADFCNFDEILRIH